MIHLNDVVPNKLQQLNCVDGHPIWVNFCSENRSTLIASHVFCYGETISLHG